MLQGKAMDDYVGAPLSGLRGRRLLVGEYRIGPHPGVYLAKGVKDLPPEVADGGCDNIQVWYVVGDLPKRIAATCSANIAGVSPAEISPPVTC